MSSSGSSSLLNRLSAALGCSPDVFYGQSSNERAETLELLALWMETEDRPTRMRALEILRSGAGKASGSDGGSTRVESLPDRVP